MSTDRSFYMRSYNKTEKHLASYRKWIKENPEKLKAIRKAWKNKNRDRVLKTTSTWREKNREKIRAYAREWRKRNPERARAMQIKSFKKHREYEMSRMREWRRNNPEKLRVYRANRYALQKLAKGFCTPEQWMERLKFYGWKCFYCKKKLTSETLTIDHRIALINRGTNWPSNLVPACVSCNCSKSNRKEFKK